jgi:hypothetical protein
MTKTVDLQQQLQKQRQAVCSSLLLLVFAILNQKKGSDITLIE